MLGVGHFGEPNVRFSAEFRRQNFFRLHSLAGSNIGAAIVSPPSYMLCPSGLVLRCGRPLNGNTNSSVSRFSASASTDRI